MKTIKMIVLLTVLCGPLFAADYVLYRKDTGYVAWHGPVIDFNLTVDAATNIIIDPFPTPLYIGSTTNRPPYSNTNDIVIVPLTVADVNSDFDAYDDAKLRSLCKVLLSEINILRTNAGLSARSPAQMKAALKANLP